MTTTTTTTTTAATNTAATTTTVDDFLDAVTAGTGVPSDLYHADAVLDATVPNWRLQASGPEAISAEYARWFTDAGTFEELERRTTADGELVSYLLTWQEDGELFAAHHCHVITLADDGRIVRDTVWCGGRWGAPLLAEMGAAAHA